MRRIRMLTVLGGVLYLMFLAIPMASADCDTGQIELARVLCPAPATGHMYVCQDVHSGVPLFHSHCRIPR